MSNDLEKLPWRSCKRCYWKVNLHRCLSEMGDAETCPDFRPAKVTRVKGKK